MSASVTKLSTLPFICMLLLFAFADISTIYGSLMYWSAVIFLAMSYIAIRLINTYDEECFDMKIIRSASFRLFAFGALMFIFIIVVSGVVNQGTQYVSFKYAVKYIAMTSIVVMFCVFKIRSDFFIKAMIITFCIYFALLLVFFNFDYFSDMILVSGDDRIGLSIAYPGVIYKIGVFLSIISSLLYGAFLQKKYLVVSFLLGFVVSIDGSRTAILWLFILPVLIGLIGLLFKFKRIKVKDLLLPLLSIFVGFISAPIMKDFVFSSLAPDENSSGHFYFFDNNSSGNISHVPSGFARSDEQDLTRIEMYKFGLNHAIEAFPFGEGLTSTSIVLPNGNRMVVHNIYLQLLGDLGVLGFIAYFLIFIPVFISLFILYMHGANIGDDDKVYILGVISIVIYYLFKSLFHPLSSDITDLGFVLVSLAVLIKWNSNYDTSRS